MPTRSSAALIASALAACVCAASASAVPVSTYQAHVNGICRTFTPTLKRVEADAAAAQRAGNTARLLYDLGYGVALGLKEDTAIEAVPVPPALQTQMAPILRLFKTVDAHARAFIRDAQAKNASAALAELDKMQALGEPANRMLDHAGLLDCGSRQG